MSKRFIDYYLDAVTKKSGGGGGSATLIDKNISANGTYNASSDSADGYKKVVVNVPNPSSGTLSITENGTYDVTEKASAVVNVQSGGGTDFLAQDISDTQFTYENNDIQTLRQYAFYHSKITEFKSTSLDSIGKNAFSSSGLVKCVVPNATVLHQNAFAYTPLSVSDCDFSNVTSVENGAFQNCNFPADSVLRLPKATSVGQMINSGSTVGLLKEVYLDSVLILSGAAFKNQTSLKKVVLGNSFTRFSGSSYIFDNCPNANVLIMQDQHVVTLDNYFIFSGSEHTEGIYVPDALWEDYIVATNWSNVYSAGKLHKMSEYVES